MIEDEIRALMRLDVVTPEQRRFLQLLRAERQAAKLSPSVEMPPLETKTPAQQLPIRRSS